MARCDGFTIVKNFKDGRSYPILTDDGKPVRFESWKAAERAAEYETTIANRRSLSGSFVTYRAAFNVSK